MRVLWIALLALGMMAAGCGVKSEIAEASDDGAKSYDPMVKRFGEAVKSDDWSTAYGMTSPAFQATTTQAQLQQEYQDLVAEIQKDEPSYKPNMVEAGHGELPTDENEAKTTYGIKSVPPKSTWRAWGYAAIGEGDANGLDRGIDAWMLISEDGGKATISHVEFKFAD